VAVRNGIPRFVDDGFADSFGFQWTHFDVRQKQEDEETFELKVGVSLQTLAGMRVLDAGCGGGRYARIAAENGAQVVAVDRSRAVDKAQTLIPKGLAVQFVQADLNSLPLRPASFDLVYSIGVLHHSPDARAAFGAVAKMVRPGGRLSVWLYRQNARWQEWINDQLRRRAASMGRDALLRWCRAAAVVGGAPLLNRTLNKIVNFSNHPRWENRVCDNFDWYSPAYQSHHRMEEIQGWFVEEGFREIRELPPAKEGRLYRRAFERGWIVGSGVNCTGVRRD
jgi:SAM-dependent methyltransferase